MSASDVNKVRINRAKRIKAAQAARNMPTAILLKKKAECDVKALEIVKRLLEPCVEVDWMLQNIGQINRSHMEDVAEERAIVKMCGYVLCDNELSKVVNKKYQISTLRNKVYDIEVVKNYCSFTCYTAMQHLMVQMLTSPLWLRSEEEIPKFTIFSGNKTRSRSPPGVEINITGIELPLDDSIEENKEKNNKKNSKESRNRDKMEKNVGGKEQSDDEKKILNKEKIEFGEKDNNNSTNVNLLSTFAKEKHEKDLDKNVDKVDLSNEKISDNQEKNFHKKLKEIEKCLSTVKLSAESEINLDNKKNASTIDNSLKIRPKNPENSERIKEGNSDKKESETTNKSRNNVNISEQKIKGTKNNQQKSILSESIAERLEKCANEWITKDTINYLNGNDSEKQEIIRNIDYQDKYNALCHKLNKLQAKEERDDREDRIEMNNLRPAPHFAALKEQARDLEIKVRAFYGGQLEIETPVKEETIDQNDEAAEGPTTVVPLTDDHAPKALRRRIFLDKLNRVLPDLFQTLSGTECLGYIYTSDRVAMVKTLVTTFNLTASNIVFRTSEWTLVALLIIKMLGVIDQQIKSIISTKDATAYSTMILMSYKLNPDYMDNIIEKFVIFKYKTN